MENKNFDFAFDLMIKNEGGFILHKNEGDRGGWTFAGIAENFWPNWSGWPLVKNGKESEPAITRLVKEFYKENFWDKLNLDHVNSKIIAYNMFDFGVNAGHKTSAKLAQISVEATPDGAIGPDSLRKINQSNPEEFEMTFALAKIGRYIHIVDRNRSQERFLRGWIKRTLNVLNQ